MAQGMGPRTVRLRAMALHEAVEAVKLGLGPTERYTHPEKTVLQTAELFYQFLIKENSND